MISISIYWLILPVAAVFMLFYFSNLAIRKIEKNYNRQIQILTESFRCKNVLHRTKDDMKEITPSNQFKSHWAVFKDYSQGVNQSINKASAITMDVMARDVLVFNKDNKEITIRTRFMGARRGPSPVIPHNFFVTIPLKSDITLEIRSGVKGFGNAKTTSPEFNSRFYVGEGMSVPDEIAHYCKDFEYGIAISAVENFLYFSSQRYPKDFVRFVQTALELGTILDRS